MNDDTCMEMVDDYDTDHESGTTTNVVQDYAEAATNDEDSVAAASVSVLNTPTIESMVVPYTTLKCNHLDYLIFTNIKLPDVFIDQLPKSLVYDTLKDEWTHYSSDVQLNHIDFMGLVESNIIFVYAIHGYYCSVILRRSAAEFENEFVGSSKLTPVAQLDQTYSTELAIVPCLLVETANGYRDQKLCACGTLTFDDKFCLNATCVSSQPIYTYHKLTSVSRAQMVKVKVTGAKDLCRFTFVGLTQQPPQQQKKGTTRKAVKSVRAGGGDGATTTTAGKAKKRNRRPKRSEDDDDDNNATTDYHESDQEIYNFGAIRDTDNADNNGNPMRARVSGKKRVKKN